MLKHYKMVPVIYPESTHLDIENINIPEDIKKYIDQLERVKRFNHLLQDRPGMIDDNSKAHTIRCVYRAMSLPFSHPDLIRVLWIHDIPEITDVVDLSAIERYVNPEKAKKQEEEEKATAKKLLSREDFELFENYHIAEDFLRRSGNQVPENQQTIVANIIDVLDGNLVFVYYYTKWLQDNVDNNSDKIYKTFIYGLDIRKRMLEAVQNKAVAPKIKEAAQQLFKSYIKVAIDLWEKQEEDKIPPAMKTEIGKMKNLA